MSCFVTAEAAPRVAYVRMCTMAIPHHTAHFPDPYVSPPMEREQQDPPFFFRFPLAHAKQARTGNTQACFPPMKLSTLHGT